MDSKPTNDFKPMDIDAALSSLDSSEKGLSAQQVQARSPTSQSTSHTRSWGLDYEKSR